MSSGKMLVVKCELRALEHLDKLPKEIVYWSTNHLLAGTPRSSAIVYALSLSVQLRNNPSCGLQLE